MGGPVAVGWLFVVVFLVIAGYCLSRSCVGAGPRPGAAHRFGRDVDLAHVVMAAGMAGMLCPAGDPVPRPVWTVAFGAAAGWFAVRMVRDRAHGRGSGERVWHWHHVVEPLAMVYMLWAMPGSMSGSMAIDPLRVSVTMALLGYFAGFAVWSARQVRHEPAGAALAGGPAVRVLVSPRLAVSCHTAISVGMAYGFLWMM